MNQFDAFLKKLAAYEDMKHKYLMANQSSDKSNGEAHACNKNYMESIRIPKGDYAIKVFNQDELVTGSDYWDGPLAAVGGFYLSPNAGAYRLLVPKSKECYIADMMTGKHVVITLGHDATIGRDMLEILFQDDTNSPFSLTLDARHCGRAISMAKACSKARKFLVYSEGPKLVLNTIAYYREAPLPCFLPWEMTSGFIGGCSLVEDDNQAS